MTKKDCGCKGVEMAQMFGRPVFNPDGSLIYPKKGDEPPPDLDGYKRDPTNPWRFTKLWTTCRYRFQNQYLKPCGAVGVLSICTHPDGPKEDRQEVTYRQCQTCSIFSSSN